MDEDFDSEEKLFRAVYPPEMRSMFWKANGRLSSAAFRDKNGLSVDRGGGRDDASAIARMRQHFQGRIVSVLVQQCWNVKAVVKYLPGKNNPYHSEIHGSNTKKELSGSQRHHLAEAAVIESMD